MAESGLPFYQIVDGVRIPGSFDGEEFESSLRYKAKLGDLFVASFPKCGTTWLQTIVYLICNKGRPIQHASEFYRKMPYLDLYGADFVENAKGIYSIKVHLPFDRTQYSEEAKYIYIARNPKDVVISLFHHTKTTAYLFEDGDFDVFFDLFMDGKTDYGDFFDHTLGWYEQRQAKNVLFLTYEELKADTKDAVIKVARFMGEEHAKLVETDPDALDNILKYSSVDEMKKIFNKHMDETVGDMNMTAEDIDALPLPSGLKTVRKFIIKHRTASSKHIHLVRKGKVGGWRDVLKDEQSQRIDRKIEEKLLDTELYELWKNV